MKNKKLWLILGILIVFVVGVSFAYYVMRITFTGTGSEVDAITKEIGNVTVEITGNLEFSDTDILPGHKNISSIKLTATGDNKEIYYDLIWNGTNTLSSALNYTVYRVDSTKEVSVNCTPKEEYLIGEIRYYEECTIANESTLGEIVGTGTIALASTTTKVVLKPQESITATTNGTETYYYVVLEFPNEDEEQEQVEGGAFAGTVTVEQALQPTGSETILANMNEIRTETNFSATATEETTGVIYKQVVEDTTTALTNSTTPKVRATLLSETEDNVTYYFRGAPLDNYVKFAGFYWRIIRINENGSIRMIYSGDVDVIDALSDKEDVLANGWNDSSDTEYDCVYGEGGEIEYCDIRENHYLDIGVGPFSDYLMSFSDVEFMIENKTNSPIKSTLDEWYRNNILNTEYEIHLDTESGFCGDRSHIDYNYCDFGSDITSADSESICYDNGGIYWALGRHYGAYKRLKPVIPTPTFGCPNSEYDLYTVSGSSVGNNALTYPIGLITADEVAYAGGNYNKLNTDYYLYSGSSYWTITPADSLDEGSESQYVYDVYNKLSMSYPGNYGDDEVSPPQFGSIRPVINLSPTVTLLGSGTIGDPYTVS